MFVISIIGFGLVFAGTASAQTNDTKEVFVTFEDPSTDTLEGSEDPIRALQQHANSSLAPLEEKANSSSGIIVTERFWIVPGALVEINTSTDSAATLEQIDGVNIIERSLEPFELTSSPTYDSTTDAEVSHSLEQLAIPEVWNAFKTTGEGSSITILDTGVDGEHDDLDIAGWKDFSNESSTDPIDYDDHGTHVAGIATGSQPSDRAAYGVAPNTTLNVGAVATDCDPRCTASLETVLAGVEWGIKQESDVISLSLGSQDYVVPMINVTRNANAAGSTLVASSGNSGDGTSSSPANLYNVIGVGAIDSSDAVWSGSSGEVIDRDADWEGNAPPAWPETYVVPDVVAPGVSVESSLPGNAYGTKTGTSMAAPHVSGSIALIQSATTERHTPERIQETLRKTAMHPDTSESPDSRYGYGIIDTVRAIEALRSPASVEGTVLTDGFAGPVDEATVHITTGERTIASTETGKDGSFSIDDIPSRSDLELTVTKSGYTANTTAFGVAPDETIQLDTVLHGNAILEMNTTDRATKTALDEVSITVERGDGSTFTIPAITDSDGTLNASLPGTGETFEVTGERDGYASETVKISLDDAEAKSVQFTFLGDGELKIQPLDRLFAEPLDNANVTVTSDRGTYPVTFSSDESIATSIVPSDTEYRVDGEAPGYLPASKEAVSVDSNEPTSIEIELVGDATTDFTITDKLTSAPLSTVTISVFRPDGAEAIDNRQLSAEGKTSISVPGIDTEYEFMIESDGYDPVSASQAIESAENHEIVASLQGDTTVNVALNGELFGEPITAETVAIENDRGTYDSQVTDAGTYVIAGVPGDLPYTLLATADGYMDYEMDVHAPESTTKTAELVGSGTLAIHVEDNDGTPIENAELSIERETGEIYNSTEVTDASGTLSVAVPGLSEPYTVHSSADGYATATASTDPVDDGTTVDVTLQLSEDSGLPGFGVIGGIAALLLASAMARRKLG